jgi:hypothetical protein
MSGAMCGVGWPGEGLLRQVIKLLEEVIPQVSEVFVCVWGGGAAGVLVPCLGTVCL